MVVLHIASITNNPFNGVCIAVPQHVVAQSEFAKIWFINITNEKIKGNADLENKKKEIKQLEFHKPFDIKKLLSEDYLKPDIVVFHECYRIEYLQIGQNLRKNSIPYIILPHGELGKAAQKKKRLKKAVANFLLFNDFIKHSCAIQCLSKIEYDNTHFGRFKFIGSNGICVPQKRKINFNSYGTKFTYIGRLDAYHKGLDLMITAVAKSADFMRQNNCKLEIFGPDVKGRFEHIKQLINQAHVNDIIRLHQQITGEEKVAKLLETDVFIQTSRFEGMPLGILEAMSYGIPCLVTEGTTLGEIIKKHGAGWCTENNVESIASTIERACVEKGSYSKMSNNAIATVKSFFSWEIVAKQAINNYAEIINNLTRIK